MSPLESNKAVVQRLIDDLVNGQNYDLASEIFTDDYARHDPNTPGEEPGPEPFIDSLRELQAAFPDGEVHIGELIAEGDLVAFEGTMTGTHTGSFRGMEPTDESFAIPGNAMHRIRDGRIAETWATWDFMGLLQQIGAIEKPG